MLQLKLQSVIMVFANLHLTKSAQMILRIQKVEELKLYVMGMFRFLTFHLTASRQIIVTTIRKNTNSIKETVVTGNIRWIDAKNDASVFMFFSSVIM